MRSDTARRRSGAEDAAILAAAGGAAAAGVLVAVALSSVSPLTAVRDALVSDTLVSGVLFGFVLVSVACLVVLSLRRRRVSGARRTWATAVLCLVAVAGSSTLLLVPARHAGELAAEAQRADNERAVASWEQWSIVGEGTTTVLPQNELEANYTALVASLVGVLAEPVTEDSQFPMSAEPNPQDCGDYEHPGVRYENVFSFRTADDAASWAAVEELLRGDGFFIEATADTLVASGTYHPSVSFVSLVGPDATMPGEPWLTLTISGKCGVADD